MKKKKQRSNLLYKLIYICVFTQVAVVAACVLIYFTPSLSTDSLGSFNTMIQTCGDWASASKEKLTLWWDSFRNPPDEALQQAAIAPASDTLELSSTSDASRISGSPDSLDVSDDADTADGSPAGEAHVFTPSNELGKASDLENSDVPEDFSSYYIMLDTAMGPMIYYNQGDARWAEYLYGGQDPMKGYGCGPTSISMLISSFSQEGGGLSPVELADWAAEHDFHASGGGSYHTLIENALSSYGLNVESVTEHSMENTAALLENDHVLVALMKKGTLTQSSGHFILITKLLDNGNVWIADPGSYENCRKEWELDMLLSELKLGAGGGGPLWAVSMGE